MSEILKKPIHRSKLRSKMGLAYYSFRRHLLWYQMKDVFAHEFSKRKLPYTYFTHQTILMRKLKDVDMWMQENKVINLKIAVKQLDGLLLRPNEIFSYWKLIGKPTKAKGYVDGMILQNGSFTSGIGGGLCQLSNLIFWMSIHTPLTVIERHRHDYDVFPDSNRSQPFGSGATCYYPHGDLMIRNDTNDTYQLKVEVGDKYLKGEWRVSSEPKYRFEIVERNHEMRPQYWGGYSRHNELYKQTYDLDGHLLNEFLIVKNNAMMMYSPFIENQDSSNK
ncbi:MAG: VanW family protein [Traorella sp.]